MVDKGLVWLASLAMGIAEMGDPVLRDFESKLLPYGPMEVSGKVFDTFLTLEGTPWVRNSEYTLYVCSSTGRYGVAKVSARVDPDDESPLPQRVIAENAESLRREAKMLTWLRSQSIALDATMPAGKEYFHHSFFPEVIAECETDDGGYVEILGYPLIIKSLASLEPASRILAEGQRTGLESAWVLGKFFKVLWFIHKRGITNGHIDADNVLLATGEHLPILFDWRFSQKGVYRKSAHDQEIMQATQIYVDLVGGHYDGTHVYLPFDGDVMTEAQNAQFAANFERILSGNCGSAYEEWARFYEIAHAVWPKYLNGEGVMQHPFHTFRLIDQKKVGM